MEEDLKNRKKSSEGKCRDMKASAVVHDEAVGKESSEDRPTSTRDWMVRYAMGTIRNAN